MKNMQSHTFLLIVIAFFSGCSSKGIQNLTESKKIIQNYYEDGRFEKDVKKSVDNAIHYFSSRVCCNETSAVVFDIDDTLLSSYDEMKSIAFGYVPKLFHEWVLKANAPEVPQVKRLYDFFVSRGCTIILLTGRRYDERDATIKNLKSLGFNKIDLLITRQDNELSLSALEYKSQHRKRLEQQGYRIIATVGDQKSDLEGGYAHYQVKIPNYTYIID